MKYLLEDVEDCLTRLGLGRGRQRRPELLWNNRWHVRGHGGKAALPLGQRKVELLVEGYHGSTQSQHGPPVGGERPMRRPQRAAPGAPQYRAGMGKVL